MFVQKIRTFNVDEIDSRRGKKIKWEPFIDTVCVRDLDLIMVKKNTFWFFLSHL